jgi:hypothetical protein
MVIFRYVNVYQRVMGNFPLWDETGILMGWGNILVMVKNKIPSSWMMIVSN